MRKNLFTGILFLALIGLLGFLWNFLRPQEQVDFSTQIKPILNNKCIACHGGVKKSGGFSLLFEDEAFAVNQSGKPAIIRGNASASELIKRIHEEDPELRMPYEKPKLSEEEIDLLTRWIDQGAKWGQHWAYSLPDKVDIPIGPSEAGFASTKLSGFIQNDIDHFIAIGLANNRLTPNEPAQHNDIVRRVSFDITGLPPDPGLLKKFEEGNLPFETLVDTLLSRKTYGENWATWWLDLARYADSKGYEKDQGREIWSYRDWVIRAFNKDLPYDQFTIEQLAGDLLPQPSVDQLIATAFHRNTMNNDEGGTDDEEFRVATVIDRVNTTFEVWQSTTMACVQCHSHPYDPFKYEDYYKVMAFFNNSRDEDTPDESPVLKFYSTEQQENVEKINQWISRYGNEKTALDLKNFLQYTEPVHKAHSFTDFANGSYDDHASLVLWDKGSCRLNDVRPNNADHIYLKYNSRYEGTRITVRERDSKGKILAQFSIKDSRGNTIAKFPVESVADKTSLYFEANNGNAPKEANIINIYWVAFLTDLPGEKEEGFHAIDKAFMELLNMNTPGVPIMVENPENMKRATQLFDRGNWLIKTDTVMPGMPETLNEWNRDWPKNRLGLSKWIVDKKNPLTARTLVNRVWYQIFGRGLVSTVEDIGSQSEPPSHPELLDWLSLRFMNEHQWSIKSLIKEIVLSGTYRQSSESSLENYGSDPDNKFYARGPRLRLSAEQIRDQALAVSGLLSPKMYGPGVMPAQPDNVWQTVYSGEKWIESKGEDKYRRALYTYLKRTSPYPSFLTFDAGSREVCTIRRTTTNTPLQALVTLNDPVYMEASYQLARTSFISDDPDKNIAVAYKRATCTEIEDSTMDTLKELYGISMEEFKTNPQAMALLMAFEENPSPELSALTIVANAIMNLDEFLTKA